MNAMLSTRSAAYSVVTRVLATWALLTMFGCTLEQPAATRETLLAGPFERPSPLTKTVTLDLVQDTFVQSWAPDSNYGQHGFLSARGGGANTIFIQPEDVRAVLEAHDPHDIGPAVIESARIELHHFTHTGGAALITTSMRNECGSRTSYPITSTSDALETGPRLGSDGTGDVLVYVGQSHTSSGSSAPGEIYHQRLDASGAPLGLPQLVNIDPYNLRDDHLPDISGDRIVWTSFTSNMSLDGRIRMKDMGTGQTVDLLTTDVTIREARIDGTFAVWVQGPNGAAEIRAYDLTWGTSNPVTLAGGSYPAANVELGSRYVVWDQRSNGQTDVVAYDRVLGRAVAVANDPAVDERMAATHGDWIAWQQIEGGTIFAIEARNMATGELRVVANNGAFVDPPSIFGDHVAYSSNSSGVYDIYVYRISDGTTHRITATSDDDTLPDVHGDKIAFMREEVDGSGSGDIYVLQLEPTVFWDEADATHNCANQANGSCVTEWPLASEYEPIPGLAYPNGSSGTTTIDVTDDLIHVASDLDCAHPGWRIGLHSTNQNALFRAYSTDIGDAYAHRRPRVVVQMRALQPEICGDGIDNDNSGAQDDLDRDGDGYSACSGDCNDGDASVYPGARELCDAVDNDCDGQVDEDEDGDGYDACDDCNNAWAFIHPGAPDICDGLDNDCDGVVDPGCGTCSSPADCNNQACISGACSACTSDTDCPSPWRCFVGMCFEPPP